MRKMNKYALAITALSVALSIMLCSHRTYSQKQNPQKIGSTQVPRPGEFPFLNGRVTMGAAETLRCGQASRLPSNGYRGGNVKIDMSFGQIAPDERTVNGRATVFGSWNVRAIYPAEGTTRPETIAAYFFDGSFTHGTILDARGGGQVFDLYGTTNFMSDMCNQSADYTTRRPVHIYGICGDDQEVNFEVLTRLPATVNGIINLDQRTVIASGIFRGNVTCGKTTDRTRVRTNLSR